MEKIIFRRERKQFIKNKKIIIKRQKQFFIKDLTKDFNTDEGIVSKKELRKKDGSVIKTNIGKEYTIFPASFIDKFRKIKRLAQIITPKDIGLIIAETGIGKQSKVVDAGAGSGALACYLAHIAKEVTTYDIRDDCLGVVQDNKAFFDLKNLKIKKQDVYKKIDEKDVDVVVLDLPEPWNALDNAYTALKPGGFLVTYLPTILQVNDLVKSVEKLDGFIYIETVELIERQWKIEDKAVRPTTKGVWHTGFISFFRKIK